MEKYIDGEPYDQSIPKTEDAGSTLGLCHAFLAEYEPDYAPPVSGYHDSESVRQALNHVPTQLQAHDSVLTPRAKERPS